MYDNCMSVQVLSLMPFPILRHEGEMSHTSIPSSAKHSAAFRPSTVAGVGHGWHTMVEQYYVSATVSTHSTVETLTD